MRNVLCVGASFLLILGTLCVHSQTRVNNDAGTAPPNDVTPANAQTADFAAEATAAMRKGVEYLLTRQQENGAWLDHPAVTSLACTAIANLRVDTDPELAEAVDRGLDYVVSLAQPDGSIWNTQTEQYPNYSTAVSLIALAVIDRPQDAEVIRAARRFLLGSQFTDPENESYGGIGYGKQLRPDLSNTQWALEALYLTDHLDREPLASSPTAAQQADLAWERARQFLAQVQNLPAVNDAVWVASDPDNRGGFVYMPGESKAGEIEGEDGEPALRSYGSMTYAGLKSLLYAKLAKDDLRVKAALGWLTKHYTWTENPGMGMAGYYYYVHTASKALSVYGEDVIVDADGTPHEWRQDVVRALLSRQQPDGSWVNDNGRWWESVPELVTAYNVIALETAVGSPDPADQMQ
jgi:squalene-hopene/tetraprenyl-beta-curcumene cyclase